MIIDRTINILHFEDDKVSQKLIKKRMKMEFHARVKTESTLHNLDIYFKTHLIDQFHVVICDFCFPGESADSKLEILAKSKKTIIFNTCLDEDDFHMAVWDKLGDIPSNFVFVRKADKLGLGPLISAIRNQLR
tara:strand:- start:3126 stop:3524 length:399 start_codon:yes stop_codon:yes gene_type:complete